MMRRIEFLVFFMGIPLGIAVALPPSMMFAALFALTALGLVLLAFTEGFAWRSLVVGFSRISWGLVATTAAVTFAASWTVLMLTRPEALFSLFGDRAPRIWGGWLLFWAIALFYPLVSALPQELVFRPLFFRRYGGILPSGNAALVLNAGIFSLAHLMYWSAVVAIMTFFGGLVFAWSYERRGNFPETVVLHSVAGLVLFATGMGAYFYTGNVVRPF